ncbi:MAG: M48 family peptidase [Bryobacterales bacterium]|nr:M48 family peptidase [Bryobacterales bacterium]
MAVHQLQLFESTKDIYYRVFRQLRPRTIPPEILIRFKPYANANCYIRWKDQQLHVSLADSLKLIPPKIAEAIAFILLSKIYRKSIPEAALEAYREYMNHPETRDRHSRVRRERGRKRMDPAQGNHFDLDEIFKELNSAFFGNSLDVPAIGWSRNASNRVLGHYDATHHAIVLSRFLDRREAGYDLVRYVMYHEMLHIKHPIEYDGSRRIIHSRKFREEEKRYPDFAILKEKLRDLCHRKRSSRY